MKRRMGVPITAPEIRSGHQSETLPINTFEDAFKAFLSDNLRKGLTEETNIYYLNKLKVWKLYFNSTMNRIVPMEPKNSELSDFLGYLVETKGTSHNGLNHYIRSIKRFYNYLYEIAVIDKRRFEHFRQGKEQDVEIVTLTEIEIHMLLDACNTAKFTGYRDYVMFLFMLDTGVRLREMSEINVDDIVLEEGYVIVLGKNRQYRNAPFSEMTGTLLKNWITTRGYSPSERLFISQNDTALSKRSIQSRFETYAKKVDIGKPISPHVMRHTFAKMYIQSGGRELTLQKLLDHSTLEMVKRYVRLYSKDIKEAHRKHSPLNRIHR